MFGKYGPLPTAAASYENGYETGFKWNTAKDFCVPDGPYHYGPSPYETNLDRIAYIDATLEGQIENHAAWLRGWTDGFKARYDEISSKN